MTNKEKLAKWIAEEVKNGLVDIDVTMSPTANLSKENEEAVCGSLLGFFEALKNGETVPRGDVF